MSEYENISADCRLLEIHRRINEFSVIIDQCTNDHAKFLDAMHLLNRVYENLDEYIKEVRYK